MPSIKYWYSSTVTGGGGGGPGKFPTSTMATSAITVGLAEPVLGAADLDVANASGDDNNDCLRRPC